MLFRAPVIRPVQSDGVIIDVIGKHDTSHERKVSLASPAPASARSPVGQQ
jgi:hypothetical protein